MMMMMRTMFSSRNVLLAGKKNLAHLKWEAALRFVLPLRQPAAAALLHVYPCPVLSFCWPLHWVALSKAENWEWNGREHGVWEQHEMKRMIANIVWNETWLSSEWPPARLALQSSKTLEQPDKDKLLSKISSSKWLHFKCMEYGQWIQSRILCCSVLWGQFLRGLNGKKMLEFYTSWVGEWSIDKIA